MSRAASPEVLPIPGKRLLVSDGNLFLEGAMLTLGGTLEKVSPEAFDRGVRRGRYRSY